MIVDRDRLIARIRQVTLVRKAQHREAGMDPSEQKADQFSALERRVAHLEQLVEGLQDSVHRESERHAKLIAELQAQIQPEAMRAKLAQDARDRGL